MSDLFDHHYPAEPGHKEIGGASQGAAEAISGKAATLRDEALHLLRIHKNGLTADEIAHLMREDILTIRPRISELFAQLKIFKSDRRRPSSRGKASTVWKAVI